LIDVAGGAYWGTTYVVSPDRRSIQMLFESTDYEFADLDRDGVHELIAWNRRPFDLRCHFGIFAVRFYPEVFVRSGWQFRKVWPLSTWAPANGELENRFRDGVAGARDGRHFQIVAGFADLDGDGRANSSCLRISSRTSGAEARRLPICRPCISRGREDAIAESVCRLSAVRVEDVALAENTCALCHRSGV
jgi:hypothetical protein